MTDQPAPEPNKIVDAEPKKVVEQPVFRETLPDSYKTDPAFQNFNSLEDLAKSYKHAQSMVGLDKAEIIKKPKAGASDAEMAEYYTAIGRPSAPDKYKLPDNLAKPLPEDFVKALSAEAFAAGYTQEQFAKAVKIQSDFFDKAEKELSTKFEENATQTEQNLRKEWGSAYDERIQDVKAALGALGDKDTFRVFEDAGMLVNEKAIKLLQFFGNMVREDKIITGKMDTPRTLTPLDAKTEINKLKTDTEFMKKYMGGNKSAVDEMQRLYKYAFPEGGSV